MRPACLHTEKYLPYAKALASGWGKIDFAGDDSKDLLKVKLEIFPVDKCNATYRRDILQPDSALKDGIVDDLMICAGSSKEHKDTCQVTKVVPIISKTVRNSLQSIISFGFLLYRVAKAYIHSKIFIKSNCYIYLFSVWLDG